MFLKSNESIPRLMPFQVFKTRAITLTNYQFLVRYARATDVNELVGIQEAVYAGYSPWVAQDFLHELNHPEDRIYLVVEHRHQLVAFMGVIQRDFQKDLHVTNIAVLPMWQSHGIGHFLLGVVDELATDLSIPVTSLEVRCSNVGAQNLYRRLGYQVVAVLKGYYRDDHEDAFSMVNYL